MLECIKSNLERDNLNFAELDGRHVILSSFANSESKWIKVQLNNRTRFLCLNAELKEMPGAEAKLMEIINFMISALVE